MKFRKLILAVLILCIAFSIPAYANNATPMVNNKNVSVTKNNVKVTGVIPQFAGLSNPVFQYKLNQSVEQAYNSRIVEASAKNTRNLKFSYETYVNNNILSVVMFATDSANSASETDSFVINKATNTYVKINTVLGNNGINYANRVIANKIKNSTDIKYSVTPTVNSNTSFYVKDGNVVIVYGAGKIAYASKGAMRFILPTGNLKNYVVTSTNLFVKEPYKVKMVPLRAPLEYFGYNISWNSSTNMITVSKDSVTVTFQTGRNSYTKNKNYPKQLEYAPEIRNGITYVPISFYELLGLLYTSDDYGNVTISQYTLW